MKLLRCCSFFVFFLYPFSVGSCPTPLTDMEILTALLAVPAGQTITTIDDRNNLCLVPMLSVRVSLLYDGSETLQATFSCQPAGTGVEWVLDSASIRTTSLMHLDSATYPTVTECSDCNAEETMTLLGDPSWCNVVNHPCGPPSPCLNGGACLWAALIDYNCSCTGFWTGRNCTDCSLEDGNCRNGGTIDNVACRCDCPSLWSGASCDALEPNFTISTTPEVVVIEDSVNVTCSAQSFPEPFNLRLVFNGSKPLTASSSSPAEFSESSRQFSAQTVYTIDSAQRDDHEGNYTCTVEVTSGSPSTTTTYTSSAFFLDVNGPTAPNVTVDATPESVAVGGSGVLVCQASGGQPASYSFSWSNSAGDTVSSGVTSSGSRSTLNITEAADDDFDTYTCTVNSDYWNVSASGNFTELDLPLASLSLSNPDPVVLGTSVRLNCSSVGSSPFNLSILVDGEVLASRNGAGRTEDLTYELLISNEANCTEYTCQAVNMFGSGNTTVTIVRATPPNVTAVSELVQTVTVDSGFTLQAEISDYNVPIDSVVWQRGSEALNSSGQFNISSDTGTLGSGSATLVVHSTASLVDDAQYTLTVTNPAGNDTLVFDITIQIAPMAALRESSSPNVTVREYSSGSVVCNVTGTPPPNITWTVGGQTAMNGSEFTISQVDTLTSKNNEVMSTLTVLNASRGNLFSEVACQASNGIGADVNDSTILLVEFAPNITSLSEEQTILASTSISISCTVDTYPLSSISWYLDGEAVDSSRVTTVALGDGRTQNSTLSISSASIEDSSTYRCQANNSISVDTMETQLTVDIAPMAALRESSSPNVTVREYSSGSVVCNVTGTPPPNITWTVGGQTAMNGSEFTISQVDTLTSKNNEIMSTLTVLNASRDNLFSEVACQASNGIGADVNDSTALLVEFAPNITSLSEEQTILVNTSVSISCTVDTYPLSSISWYLDGQAVDSSRVTTVALGDGRTQNSTLSISSASTEDSGTYRCQANNSFSMDTMETQLTVELAPLVLLEDLVVNETQTANLTCYVTGNPQASITWYLVSADTGRSVELMTSMDYIISEEVSNAVDNNVLVVSVLSVLNAMKEDSGLYRCNATNTRGMDSSTANLTVQAKPQLSPVGDIRSLSAVREENVTIQFMVVEASPPLSADNITWTVTTSAGVLELDCNSTSKHIFSSDCLSVTVTSVTAVDVGSYMVSAVTIAGTGSSAVDVTIRRVKPLITYIMGSMVAVSGTGTNHTFVCNAVANPSPSFYWRFQDQTIEASANRYTISSDSTQSVLTVKMIEVGDDGIYECVASNAFGTDSKNISLTVQFPPVFKFTPRLERDVELGAELLVSCTAESLPAPRIVWVWRQEDQRQLLIHGSDDAVSITSTGNSTVRRSVLTVQNISQPGRYSCRADNIYGSREAEPFSVNIITRIANIMSFGDSSRAAALIEGGVLTREEFTSLVISCNATGEPVPVVEWMHRGAALTGDRRRTVTTAPGYAVLALTSLQSSDAGMFTCRASNGNVAPIPGQTTVLFHLVVQARNECAMDPYPCRNGGLCTDAIGDYVCMCTSTIETAFSGKNCSTAVIGRDLRTTPDITTQPTGGVDFIFAQSVSLECAASGIPTPVISWWKDGTALTGPQALGRTFTIDRLRPEDRGTYRCQATNVVGTARSNPTDVLIAGIVQFRVAVQLNAANREKRQTISSLDLALQTLAVGQMLSGTNNVSAETVSLARDQINGSLFIVTVNTNSSQPPRIISQIVEQPLTGQFQEYSDILRTVKFAVQSTLRYDGCPMETSVGCSNAAHIVWPETEIGQEVVVRCPCGPDAGNPVPANVVARRRCRGTYSQGAVWESEKCTACEFSMNRQQMCSLREEASAPRVLASLTDISSNFSDATSVDITIMVDLLQLVNTYFTNNSAVADMEEAVQGALNFLEVVDNIQDYDADQLRESNRQNGSLNSALVLIDVVTDWLALQQNSSKNETVTIALNNYGVQFVRTLATIEPFTLNVASLISEMQNRRNSSGLEAADSPVSIEATLPGALSNGTLSMVYFLNRALFPISTNNTIQAGGILSLSMPGVTVTNLSEPFTLNFEKTQAVIDTPVDLRKPYGVFWDTNLNDGQGNWSTDGCSIVEDNGTHCAITCNHFTSFSILLDISPADNSGQPEVEAFTYISYIGCSISVVTLVIFIGTYLCNKKLRDNLHLKLLINLSFTLVGLYVTFIITDTVSSFKEILPSIPWLCAILSATLQYFVLCFFIAMAAIAFNLYKMLVVVLDSNITSYLPTAVVLTWVIPLFVVAISVAPKHQYYTGEIIANETIAYCRAQSWPFYFGVALPFVLAYLFNMGIFIVIGIKLINRPTLQMISLIDAGKFRRYKENFFLTIGITIVLGLTWIFGFLATGALPRPIAIPCDFLFTLFASFHGLSIFVFYGVKRSECRELWRDWLSCRFSREKRDHAANRRKLIKARREASRLQGTRSPCINCCLPSPATRLSTHNNATSVMPPAPSVDFVYEDETPERQKSVKFDLKETKEYDCSIEMMHFDDSSSASSFYFGLDPITGDALINGDVDKTDSGVTQLQGDCTVIANKQAEIATTDLDLGRDVEVCRVKMDSLIEAADSGNDCADGTVVMVNESPE